MNNKGQTLVVFVLLLPLVMMITASVIEIGRLSIINTEYKNSITDAINYGLDNLDKENVSDKMKKLLDKNISGTKNIDINDGVIKIHVTSSLDGMFSSILKKAYSIDITYIGYLEADKKIIVKD